jgi:hypothetical protein
MDLKINEIIQKLENLGYKIQKNGKLKKNGGRQLDAEKVYKDNFDVLKIYLLDDFVNAIMYASEIKSESTMPPIHAILSQCEFLYKKFRWLVTKDFTKIYYLKTRDDAEEYRIITTDRESLKFFNTLTDEELIKTTQIIFEYNSNEANKDNYLSEEKLLKMLMEDLRKTPAYRLQAEPVTLSNKRDEPCFKFFDIQGILEKGDKYKEKHGYNPKTPSWDQFFSRIRDSEMINVVKAFITGIFIAENRAKQCLYIWGAGDDGKSQITHALSEAMSDDVTFVLDQYLRSNQFSSYDAYGKRLCIGEEMSAPNIIKNKTLHAITGQSLSRVEPKGEQSFKARLYSCAIITSNEKPNIEDVKNQTTRILYVEVDSAKEEDINDSGIDWGKNLVKELPALIYNGMEHYKFYNKNGSSYKMPKSYSKTLETLYDEETIFVEEFIETYFVEDSQNSIRDRLGHAFVEFLTLKYFKDKNIPNDYKNSQISKKIKEKLHKKFPSIKSERTRYEGIQVRVIHGLKLKTKTGPISDILDIEL